ncbi:MAG: CDP-alcohol phosphatidyltransferase [Candidatus Rokuibacteriota bacterium]|nr:MAG: CDP-alcohol phosphatidyltransferase [Candidatus Rokubacteria bacterium]
MEKARTLGLRRGGPEPGATRAGQPLRPITLPNLVGYVRLALLAAFLVIALSSDDGRVPIATAFFAIAAAGDYLDGLLARVTGQYSRLGALMDPLIDRLVVVSGVVVAWKFELLPRWALAVLIARELAMVVLVAGGLRLGLDLHINWIGRIAIWPTMAAFGTALFGWDGLDEVLLYVGLAGSIAASAQYVRDGIRALRASP